LITSFIIQQREYESRVNKIEEINQRLDEVLQSSKIRRLSEKDAIFVLPCFAK